jgi:hypothetical protein
VKKAIILVLATMYLGITSGVMVNIHYCMGRIAEVNYGHDDDKNCSKCGMEQKDGCCKTEHKLIKSSTEHLLAKTFTSFEYSPADMPQEYPEPQSIHISGNDHFYLRYHSPPDKRSNELRLYNGVFRI